MFGFLRANRCDRQYRQLYAGCCAFQHRQFGVESLPLLSYEAVFLYLLAVDAGACDSPDRSAVTCCRLRCSSGRLHKADAGLATFCSSFGLLLASIKLEDDVRDDGSLLARLALWRLNPRIERAKDYFANLEPRFRERIGNYIEQHLRSERAGLRHSLEEYAEPTANAFGFMFELFAHLLPDGKLGAPVLREIGSALGKALICFDCAVDWRRDRRRGRFNPLPDRAAPAQALLTSQRWLSHAGWQCSAALGPQSRATAVVGATFERVQAYVRRADSNAAPAPRRWRRPIRRGDCDCACDAGCCEGCDCCGDGAEHASHDACACFCPDCVPCCDRESQRSKKKEIVNASPVQTVNRKGLTGRTLGPLNPSGVVLINGERVPAQSQSGWINADTEVEVVSDAAFGVVVRPKQPGFD